VDILDSGSLKIQYNRNRYYDYYTGRWLTHDPLGYIDGMNLYDYVKGSPIRFQDPLGTIRRIKTFATDKCKPCELLYAKNCSIIDERIHVKSLYTSTKKEMTFSVTDITWEKQIFDTYMENQLIDFIAKEIVASFGRSASAPGLPSAGWLDEYEIKPYREEYFYFYKHKCGKNCRWEPKAELTYKKEEITGVEHKTDKITDPSGVRDEIKEIWQKHGDKFRETWKNSLYCHDYRFVCTKGKKIVDNPRAIDKKIYLCEKFVWKTK
jgi:RHS repeat-associated protein